MVRLGFGGGSLFERLPGLPATGPWPEQFSASGTGTHREGLVVRFMPTIHSPWVGNFRPGLSGYNAVLKHPDDTQVIVIAGGQGYIVDPEMRQVTHLFGGDVCQTYQIEQPRLVVVEHEGISFEAFGPNGQAWHTGRISWDGFRNVRMGDGRIVGDAWSPLDSLWYKFEVDVETGRSSGGSYK